MADGDLFEVLRSNSLANLDTLVIYSDCHLVLLPHILAIVVYTAGMINSAAGNSMNNTTLTNKTSLPH